MFCHFRIRGAALVALAAVSALAIAQTRYRGASETAEPGPRTGFGANAQAPRPGDPLPGLTGAQLVAFAAGYEAFITIDTPESGLGPIYNAAGCIQCHSAPAAGGMSPMRITRFGRAVGDGFDSLAAKGGSMLQRFAIDPAAIEVIPPEANVIADRLTTPLFGAGLIDAIPDEAIVAVAAQAKSDGISGRAVAINDVATGKRRIGRFGWKSQQATLLAFIGAAYVNEIGITNRLFPEENAPNGNDALLAQFDKVAELEDPVDPVTGRSDVDRLGDFIRMLAPPSRLPMSPSAQAGEGVFMSVGCASCHLPSFTTGASPVAALANRKAELYSDLLVHDMGALGDGIAQGSARTREMRTAPLWGLRTRHPFLHDGRAATVDQAIRAHDGEAAIVRDRYQNLPPEAQRQLRDFLYTL